MLLPQNLKLFCRACLDDFTFCNPADYCRACFHPFESSQYPICMRCLQTPAVSQRFLSVLESTQTNSILFRTLSSHAGSFLIPAAAALMAFQLIQEKMTWPALIIKPVASRLAKIMYGSSTSEKLASSLSKIMHINLCPSHSQQIEDKHILIVQDRNHPGLQNQAEIVAEFYPRSITILTLFNHDIF